MAKCCEGDWDSTINGQPDGTLSIHSEDEVTGDIQGTHGNPIKLGKCKGNVTYEVEKGGITYTYKGKADAKCETIEGTRKKKEADEADGDDDVWVATKGSGGEDKPGKGRG